jgi:hypothetical protein
MFQTQAVETIKNTNFMFNNFFFENDAIYEMWKNTAQPGGPQYGACALRDGYLRLHIHGQFNAFHIHALMVTPIYSIRPTNARMWNVFITRHSLPTCFSCCCGHNQGKTQNYRVTNIPPYSMHIHRKQGAHFLRKTRLPAFYRY